MWELGLRYVSGLGFADPGCRGVGWCWGLAFRTGAYIGL